MVALITVQFKYKLYFFVIYIYNKMKRDNFSEKELVEIGNALDCDFVGQFKMKDTTETI